MANLFGTKVASLSLYLSLWERVVVRVQSA